MPITQTVLATAQSQPDQLAIVGATEHITYRELVDDSRWVHAAAEYFHRAPAVGDAPSHVTPPRPAPETDGIPITAISISSAFHTARIIAGLAGYRAVSATIDPLWPLEHQTAIITATGIGLVISDSAKLATALRTAGWQGSVISLRTFRQREAELRTAEPDAPAPRIRAGDEPFLMLFSSGTTDRPKAFIKTREQYRANFAVSSAYLEPFPGVATLAPGPVSYSLTLYAVIESLASGGSVHLADQVDPIELSRRIGTEQVTRIVAVPAIAQALASAAHRSPGRFSALSVVIVGGANLSATIRERFASALPGVRLISYYGAAEIGFIGDSRGGDGTKITIYDGILAEIRGADGTRLPDGELGTLWVKAAACSTGYVAGTTDADLVGPDGWATVHDQGWMDSGRLSLAGRAGDIAITGGHKVSLLQVERAFDDFPGIGAVCAVALPDVRLGTVVALVIEEPVANDAGALSVQDSAPHARAGGTGPAKTDLIVHARQRLAPQFVPHRWYRIARLPRTVGGKIQRAATAALIEPELSQQHANTVLSRASVSRVSAAHSAAESADQTMAAQPDAAVATDHVWVQRL